MVRYIFGLLIVLLIHSIVNAQNADTLPGVWHANSNGWPITITLAQQGAGYVAYVSDGDGQCHQKLDGVSWDSESGQLEFRRSGDGMTQWYKVTIGDGLMIGRFSHIYSAKAPKPTDQTAYKYHLTGWSEQYFNRPAAVWDVFANDHFRARLRVDRLPNGQLVGRFKNYGYLNTSYENAEEDITVTHWDGDTLAFTRGTQSYTGTVDGRYITGKFTQAGQAEREFTWSGRRAEVLTYGLAPKTAEDRAAWQERTRRQLYRLMMASNPAPLSINVEIIRDGLPPIAGSLHPLRDDDPDSHPQNYTLSELELTYTVPNWLGGAPITREVHAYLARPNSPGPHPLVVAVNGHLGSAYKVMDGSTIYWYGDSWARRGYMVLAIDIGHRPGVDVVKARYPQDLSTFLGYAATSNPPDDAANGNGLRSSIKPPKPEGVTDADWAYFTDYEEDGERVSDVMRAIDYAVSREDVDASKIIVTGLSLGGEVASYVGALDPRVRVTIPAGFSPDFSVFKYLRGANHCLHLSFADIREYIDQSDVLSLIAPRLLIVETGKQDRTYSEFPHDPQIMPPLAVGSAPFAADKQVMRRVKTAYGAGPLFHFLHHLGHEYRTGLVTYPTTMDQTSGETTTDGRTLFDIVAEWLAGN